MSKLRNAVVTIALLLTFVLKNQKHIDKLPDKRVGRCFFPEKLISFAARLLGRSEWFLKDKVQCKIFENFLTNRQRNENQKSEEVKKIISYSLNIFIGSKKLTHSKEIISTMFKIHTMLCRHQKLN